MPLHNTDNFRCCKESGESKTFFKKHVPKRRSTDIYKYKGKRTIKQRKNNVGGNE